MKKKILKALSVILSVCMVLSVCLVGTVTAVAEVTREYYVKYDGTAYSSSDVYGTNGTKANPYKTMADVTKAIAADSAFNVAGNVANVYVMQDITSIAVTSQTSHNIVKWGTGSSAHNATIVVKADADNTFTGTVSDTIICCNKFGDGSALAITGPVVLDDITLLYPYNNNNDYGSQYRAPINANGNDLKVSSTTDFAYLALDSSENNINGSSSTGAIQSAINSNAYKKWDSQYIPKDLATLYTKTEMLPVRLVAKNTGTAVEHTKEVNFEIDNAYATYNSYGTIVIAEQGHTFKEDVTVDIDNLNGTQARVDISRSAGAVFEKNLNIKLSNANAFGFRTNGAITVLGGFQLITEAVTYNVSNTAADAYAKAYKSDGTTPADVWNLKINGTGINNIDFTSEAGKFQLTENASAIATSEDGSTVVYSDENGVLDLTAKSGKYTVDVEVNREQVTEYYVRADGTGDGTDPDNPAPTVATAINTINNYGLTARQTATITIMQNVNTITSDANRIHNLAIWGDKVEHAAKIIIKADSATNKDGNLQYVMIATSSKMGSAGTITFGGPTEIQDVCIFMPYGSNVATQVAINMNAQDVIIGENAKFAYFNGNSKSYADWVNADFFADNMIVYSNLTQAYVTYGNTGATIDKAVNVTINKGYNTYGYSGEFLAVGDSTDTFKQDVTVNLNLKDESNARFFLGKNVGGATFEKNLNVKILAGYKFAFRAQKDITVNGGLQLIYSDAVSFSDSYDNMDDKAFDENGDPAKSWYIKVADADIGTVDFVEGETGKFKAKKEGLVAVATKVGAEEGELPISANAEDILDLSSCPGEYTISYVNEYTSDGQTICIYKDMSFDLANEKHIDKNGKLFIGWKYANKDSYPQTTNGIASLKANDVLVADFIDVAETDFAIEDIELRYDSDSTAIRYVVSKNKAFEEKINSYEYGAIYLPADSAQGFEIFLDKKPVSYWNVADDPKDWTPGQTVDVIPEKFVADSSKILAENGTELKYSFCLTGITADSYNKFYALRGYAKFKDKNGVDSVAYTNQAISSLYKEACDTFDTEEDERTSVHSDIITQSEANKTTDYNSFMDSLQTPWERGENLFANGQTYEAKDEATLLENNQMIYRSSLYGVQYVRKITVNTGKNINDEMLFITDTHVTYTNEKDINTRNINALEYFISRCVGSERWQYAGRAVNSVNLASLFKKTIHGGDFMDYISDGNYQAVKRIWTDRSIKTGNSLYSNLSMAPGNHEFSQASNPVKLTEKEMHDNLDKVMPNNSYIDYDIVKDANGNDSYMTIVLDNASGDNYSYYDCQVPLFKQYIEYANKNKLPVLIFQHVPLNTGDTLDSEIWYKNATLSKFTIGGRQAKQVVMDTYNTWKANNPNATESEKSKWVDANIYKKDLDGDGTKEGWSLINMYDSYEHTGADYIKGTDTTSATAQIYDMIKENAGTIKAIFAGHHHANYTTYIQANDGTEIPQYVLPSGYDHCATIINVN